ncbi:MAG: S1 RNA-binding domain-containing protein [Lachnospiraceae bacterium]|nr:S1 RNA-binding domain-containing protein [Lachnospiraceae bacterium]
MFKLGEMNRLTAVRKTEHGMYFSETKTEEETVLLPRSEVPADLKTGDVLTLFLYRDSSDRIVATVKEPKIRLHEVKLLQVKDTGKIGAFVDWGLAKDLLLPFREQTKKVSKGEEILAALYIDKTGRLALTMNVYEYLQTDSAYKKDDTVSARVYLISDNFGAFAAVDDTYSALIPRKELFSEIRVGDVITARVTEVKDDGKLSLSIRKKAHEQMDDDAEIILRVIRSYGGKLPFNDKADPETIKNEFHMSKAAFKRAVGRLYKERRIEITPDSIVSL